MKLMPPRWPEWDNLPVYRELLPEPASEDLPVEKLPPPAIVEFLPGEKVQDPLPFSSSEDEDEDLRETRVFVEALRKLQPPQRLNEEQKKRIRANKPGGCGPGTSPALTDQPRGYLPISWSKDWIFTPGPPVQSFRTLAQLLQWDGRLRAEEGDLEGAVRSFQALLNDGSALRDVPHLAAQLVHIAIQSMAVGQLEHVLAQGELPEATLGALQARLEEEAAVPVVLIGVRGERAGIDRLFQALQNGDVSVSTLIKAYGPIKSMVSPAKSSEMPDWFPEEYALHFPGAVAQNRIAALRRMNRLVEILQRNPELQPKAIKEWDAAGPGELPLVYYLTFTMSKIAEYGHRRQAILHCAAVALAAERYRRQHGRWPSAWLSWCQPTCGPCQRTPSTEHCCATATTKRAWSSIPSGATAKTTAEPSTP